MKNKIQAHRLTTSIKRTIVIASVVMLSAYSKAQSQSKHPDVSKGIFPKGKQGPAENFTGKVWNYGLVPADSSLTTVVGNVYFEPGARSNWHEHPAGQILIITEGSGYHQIKGQPREELKKGDVVKCPPGVVHWHGATANSGMQQMYIIPNVGKGIVKWMQPVTDQEYNNQK
ncbi:cupin domain-containing protein [Dyadobacter sp. CY312]|uniref:cupin domain-containing protein n=1 Tax=Dyadobacter sp. CY312 TaxID=2907303 RepID=UPI001F253131|nr:cupin domain-containing protein [Dyadobacter sp. CY312]MCE7039052.1 cupin domain-containing protein [Dyadobacter sp. CY312]